MIWGVKNPIFGNTHIIPYQHQRAHKKSIPPLLPNVEDPCVLSHVVLASHDLVCTRRSGKAKGNKNWNLRIWRHKLGTRQWKWIVVYGPKRPGPTQGYSLTFVKNSKSGRRMKTPRIDILYIIIYIHTYIQNAFLTFQVTPNFEACLKPWRLWCESYFLPIEQHFMIRIRVQYTPLQVDDH